MKLLLVLALAIVRPEPDFESAPRVVQRVLRIGRRREAEGRSDIDHPHHGLDRYRNLHPHPARRTQFALIDNVRRMLIRHHYFVQVLRDSPPTYFGLVMTAVVRAMQEQRLGSEGRQQLSECALAPIAVRSAVGEAKLVPVMGIASPGRSAFRTQ